MKNAHNINDRFTGSVIFTAEIQVADDAPEALRLGAATAVAIAAKADLSGANLRHADLRHAVSVRPPRRGGETRLHQPDELPSDVSVRPPPKGR